MAGTFPITEARQELGFTPTTAVRADIDVRQGDVGGAIGQALVTGARELQRRSARRALLEENRQKFQDTNAAIDATSLTKSAIDLNKAFRLKNTNTELWESDLKERLAGAESEIGQLSMSEDARTLTTTRFGADSLEAFDLLLIDQTGQEADNTRRKVVLDITEAIRSGTAQDRADAVGRFREVRKDLWPGASVAKAVFEAAVEAGKKGRKDDILKGWSNRIAEDPALAEVALEAELTARKKDEGTIPEDELPSKDIQSLINLANARQVQLEADTQAARNKAQRDLENELYDGLDDKTKNVTDVSKSKLDASAKRRLVRDEKNFAERDINKTWPLVDNDDTVQRLDSQLTSLEAGTIDRTQMNQQINAAAVNGELIKATRDKFRSLSKKGGRDAIDTAVKSGVDRIRNALLSRLSDREARTKIRALAGELTPQEQREASSNAYLLQVNKNQLLMIEGEIERRMRQTKEGVKIGRDVISGIEATAITSTVWEEFRQKTLGQKINDFKEFSGQRIPKPSGFPQDVWEEATDSEKVDFVAGSAEGFSDEDMIKAFKR